MLRHGPKWHGRAEPCRVAIVGSGDPSVFGADAYVIGQSERHAAAAGLLVSQLQLGGSLSPVEECQVRVVQRSSCQAAWSLRCVGRISSVVFTRIIFCPLAPARLATSGAFALRGAVPWASTSRRPCAAARRTGAWPALRSRRPSSPFRVAEQHAAEVSRAGCVHDLGISP